MKQSKRLFPDINITDYKDFCCASLVRGSFKKAYGNGAWDTIVHRAMVESQDDVLSISLHGGDALSARGRIR